MNTEASPEQAIHLMVEAILKELETERGPLTPVERDQEKRRVREFLLADPKLRDIIPGIVAAGPLEVIRVAQRLILASRT
jgi:hypothetical protein